MKKYITTLKISVISLMIMILLTGIVNATVIYYNQPNNGYWNIDQNLWIEQKAPTTFWAIYFDFAGKTYGGYHGLQTTVTGDKALFSIWNATAASPFTGIEGTGCNTFSGEGVGYHCYLPINITPHTVYKLRVWILNSDQYGQWWGAWVINGTTENFVGQIRTNISNTRLKDSRDFTEYYGSYSYCNQIPRSIVDWQVPSFNNKESTGAYSSNYTQACNNYSNVTTEWIKVDKGS